MQTMLLGMSDKDMYIYFLLQYICFQLIKSILMMIFYFYRSTCLKSVNHSRKILELPQPTIVWFVDVIHYFNLVDLCSVAYMTINHNMHATFVEM